MQFADIDVTALEASDVMPYKNGTGGSSLCFSIAGSHTRYKAQMGEELLEVTWNPREPEPGQGPKARSAVDVNIPEGPLLDKLRELGAFAAEVAAIKYAGKPFRPMVVDSEGFPARVRVRVNTPLADKPTVFMKGFEWSAERKRMCPMTTEEGIAMLIKGARVLPIVSVQGIWHVSGQCGVTLLARKMIVFEAEAPCLKDFIAVASALLCGGRICVTPKDNASVPVDAFTPPPYRGTYRRRRGLTRAKTRKRPPRPHPCKERVAAADTLVAGLRWALGNKVV